MDGGNKLNYVGEKCAACGQVFTEEDDVVVCPDCGSPHHRNCYLEHGKCANEDFHFTGKKWERQQVKDKAKDFVICPVCHFPNSKDAGSCERCGTELHEHIEEEAIPEPFSGMFDEEIGQPIPYLGFDPNEDLGGATVKEVSDFVRTNTIYYLPIFKRMKDIGTKISFNLTCLFFPHLYFANRKMWGWAFIAVILNIFFNIPAFLIFMAEDGSMPEAITTAVEAHNNFLLNADRICNYLNIGVKLLFCLLGNRIYFKYILRSLKKIKESRGGYTAAKLYETGGVKPSNMILIILIYLVIAGLLYNLGIYAFDFVSLLNDLDSAAVISSIFSLK